MKTIEYMLFVCYTMCDKDAYGVPVILCLVHTNFVFIACKFTVLINSAFIVIISSSSRSERLSGTQFCCYLTSYNNKQTNYKL